MDKTAQWSLVAAAWFLAICVAVLGILAYRHVTAPPPLPVSPYVVAPDGLALCPVTGQRVPVSPQTPQLNYQGQVYYFSTQVDADKRDARTLFLMDPEKYLHPAKP